MSAYVAYVDGLLLAAVRAEPSANCAWLPETLSRAGPILSSTSSEVRGWREGCGTGWRAHCEWAPVVSRAVSVTAGTDSGPQDAVIFKTPGRRRSSDICDEAAGTQCRG